MALGTRMWSAGKFFVLLGALAATYVVSAATSMRLAMRARQVQVPDLVNRLPNDATMVANEVGLTVRVDDQRRPDAKVPAGRVLGQDPAAGLTTRRQRSVRVWLSAGPQSNTVPALTGETERASLLRLSQQGLELTGVSEIRSSGHPSDVVVGQDPPARAGASKVMLLVNRAQQGASYVMPDLIGVNGERAASILRDHGFRVTLVGAAPYPGVAAGIVVRQSPQGGFQISAGEPVSLEVSR
ncbi:MAG: PASTA domain-containing protein [Vicinamibacterales bacterium]